MELIGLKGFSAWSVYNKVIFNLIFLRENNVERRCFHDLLADSILSEDIKQIKTNLSDMITIESQISRPISECLQRFKNASKIHKRVMLVEAMTHANLDDDEALRLLSLHKDSNGIGYSKGNVGNIKTSELLPMLIDSLMYCSEIDCDLGIVTQAEIDSLDGKRIDVNSEAADIIGNDSKISTRDLLALAIKRVFKGGVE